MGSRQGARETLLAIIDELKIRQKLDVTVTETAARVPGSLLSRCRPGQSKTVYGNVDPSRARQIVVSHLVNLAG